MNKLIVIILSILVTTTLTFVGCSKGGGDTTPPPNPCASKTIVVTGTATATTTPTSSNGTISASATGSSGFTFSLNGGTFQASGTFTGLAVGSYTITAKDGDACTGSQIFSVTATPCPTITSSAATTNTVKCESNTGTITVTASGSTGFTYNLNGGTFQASNTFASLASGIFSYGVRDDNGCITTGNATVSQAPAGPLFSAVKAVLAANCATPGCHSGATPQSGLNYTDDCTIVNGRLRIKARAVDASPSVMPPSGFIPALDRQKIVDWINAGGKHSN